MFLHLGADTVVLLKNVVAITDLKMVKSNINNEFLENMRASKSVIDVSEQNAKSIVVTDTAVYLTAISSVTLKKRADNAFENIE
jgi:isoprenylcysteine carboxyl methyltransferase (ICMT) family protein YpbQ